MDMWSTLTCLLLAWVLIHFLHSILKRSKFCAKRLPPGPLPIPLVGNIFSLGRNPHISLMEIAKTYGPVITVEIGFATTIVVSSVDMAKEVLQKNDASFAYRYNPSVVTVTNHLECSVVFLHPGSKWRAMRSMCASLIFSNSRLNATEGIRSQKIQELVSYVERHSEAGISVNINQAVFNSVVNFLSSMFFSKDLADPDSAAARELKELVWSLVELVGEPNIADLFPMFKSMDLQGIRSRAQVLIPKMMNIFDSLIKKRLEAREFNDLIENNDVLDSFLDIALGNDAEVEVSDLPHLFADLIASGHTVTSSVEWGMTELMRLPEKMKIVQAELDEVIGKATPYKRETLTGSPTFRQWLRKS